MIAPTTQAVRSLPHLSDNDTITNIIAWVDSRIEAEVKHRPDVNVYKRILSETWSQVRKHLVSLRTTPVDPPAAWRCFHCDESFLDQKEAEEHFGDHQRHSPACQIDIAEYRAMEQRMERYNEEDSDMHREIARLQSEHTQALIREEEKGYARGLADGAPYLAEREAAISSHEAEVGRLRIDAERYQCLRKSHPDDDVGIFVSKERLNGWGRTVAKILRNAELDRAIDKARAALTQGEQK